VRVAPLASFLLVVGPWAAAADFAAPPPQLIGGFAGFEMLGGELASPRLKAGYRFYVDPRRAALFTVMRYRLRPSEHAESPTEKFVWNERPGERAPLRCFEWVEAMRGGAWREMPAGGAAYQSEMSTLLLVLAEQNRAYRLQIETEAPR
jgi:hypothetical protein